MAKKKKESYDDIQVLKGPESIRENLGMYAGSKSQALSHMLKECLDNSIDENMAGHCNKILIHFLKDESVILQDNGRGIPVSYNKEEKKNSLEIVFTTTHSGGKFSSDNYTYSGGLHGVGLVLVNALSSWLKVTVIRDGYEYSLAFKKGYPSKKLTKKKTTAKGTGTLIHFMPDKEFFKKDKMDINEIYQKIEEISYLCNNLNIIVIDDINDKKETFGDKTNNIGTYVEHIAENTLKTKLLDNPIIIKGKKNNVEVDIGLQWSDDFTEDFKCFTNNIPNRDGGTHLAGFRSGLTRTFTWFLKTFEIKSKIKLSSDDIREGLIYIINVRHPRPSFSSQTKEKLVSEDVRGIVEFIMMEKFKDYCEKNADQIKKVIKKATSAAKARDAARRARELERKKGDFGFGSLAGKLSDCQEKDPRKNEIFIVEGDSAGGCFFSNTMISLPNSQNISFKNLVKDYENGKKHYCYTINDLGQICIGEIINPRKTKKDAKVIKIILDNGEEIICTPDHKLMTKDNEFVEAEKSLGVSLRALYRKTSGWKKGQIKGYEMFWSDYDNKWKYTHIISDFYNIQNNIYSNIKGNNCRHHVDFNKLNNYPNNIIKMSKDDHFEFHRNNLQHTLHRPDIKEKSKLAKQTPEYREKMSKKMSETEMAKMLSERAKRQWENEDYKKYMGQKWKVFYNSNEEYREENNEQLNKAQQEYWSNDENRKSQSKRVEKYFEEHPEQKKALSKKAKGQWEDKELIEWRSNETKKQWTDDFRRNRKEAYNRTYYRHTIEFIKEIFDRDNSVDNYDEERIKNGSRNLLKLSTFLKRFFNNDYNLMIEALQTYNHKVVEIIELEELMDVYDLEVPGTHNFALASGIFVHNSAKQGRDRKIQAILPLRGKVLNVEKSDFKKMLDNKELTTLVTALGVGIGPTLNPDKLRYGKVIIFTDSDVDGSHIRTLLLTFFYRQMPQLIFNENIYIAQPPLYRIVYKGKTIYLKDDREKDIFVEKNPGKYAIQRFKGLGEMNPQQLWDTSMDPKTRNLVKVSIDNIAEADRIFSILMADDTAPRKSFIIKNSNIVHNLDI